MKINVYVSEVHNSVGLFGLPIKLQIFTKFCFMAPRKGGKWIRELTIYYINFLIISDIFIQGLVLIGFVKLRLNINVEKYL